jgi:hypothetical protein
MVKHNAEIPDWSEIIMNWQILSTKFVFPLFLSKNQVNMILKLKMNLPYLWDDYAVELTNSVGAIVVRVKDVLLLGKSEGVGKVKNI